MTGRQPCDEAGAARLREQVRRAGRASGRFRLGVHGALGFSWLLVSCGVVGSMVALHAAGITDEEFDRIWQWVLTGGCVLGLLVAQLAAGAALAADRRLRQRRLRRAVAALPRGERDRLLIPLLDARHGPTRSLAEALLQDPADASALVPAADAPGRGNEPVPG